MYAQLLATFCLLFVSSGVGYSESIHAPDEAVGVYLKSEGASSPEVLADLTTEFDSLLSKAGVQIEWLDWTNPSITMNGGLAVLELRGPCAPPIRLAQARLDPGALPLASTSVVQGEVLPFGWVDCAAVNQFLGPSLARVPVARRNDAYARALARLLGHELYHILAQTTEHTRAGLAKAHFTVADLLSDDFQFTNDALLHLHANRTVQQFSNDHPRAELETGLCANQSPKGSP